MNDQQDGVWTFYDEQGRVTETGPFRAGLRHGEWTLTRSASEGGPSKSETIRYIDGRTGAELNAILDRLRPLVASDKRSKRYAALIDLADLGEGGAPLLLERLAGSDIHEQTAIVGMMPRMPTGAELLLSHVRGYCTSNNQDLAHQSRLTLFQIDPASREKLFEPLLAEALAAPTLGVCLEELTVLYRSTDSLRAARVVAQIMELSLIRPDAESEMISDAVGDLGGDVTAGILAACKHPQESVRLQGIWTLEQFEKGWLAGGSYFQLAEEERQAVLARLKGDPSAKVREAAESVEKFVPSGLGSGIGRGPHYFPSF